jgi:MinD superfamily P-loop ATPase
MIISVASGKGGTGKTTVATILALSLSTNGHQVSFLDCDVEAPNAHLFLAPVLDQKAQVNQMIPEVNEQLCSGCGRCAEVCEFHAIVTLGGKTLVFPELCHGCGSCTLVCPEKAISEVPKQIGVLERGATKEGIRFRRGLLDIGEPMAVPVISQLRKWDQNGHEEIVVRDSPPGASCPVVETLREADFIILVTEPTPFGLHDLKLAVQLTRELKIPTGVIINRDGIGDGSVEEYCEESNLPVLMRIPFDRKIGEGIAQGKPLVEIYPEYIEEFRTMYQQLQNQYLNIEV